MTRHCQKGSSRFISLIPKHHTRITRFNAHHRFAVDCVIQWNKIWKRRPLPYIWWLSAEPPELFAPWYWWNGSRTADQPQEEYMPAADIFHRVVVVQTVDPHGWTCQLHGNLKTLSKHHGRHQHEDHQWEAQFWKPHPEKKTWNKPEKEPGTEVIATVTQWWGQQHSSLCPFGSTSCPETAARPMAFLRHHHTHSCGWSRRHNRHRWSSGSYTDLRHYEKHSINKTNSYYKKACGWRDNI